MKEDAHGGVVIPDKFYFKIGEVSESPVFPPMCCGSGKPNSSRSNPSGPMRGSVVPQAGCGLVLRIKHLLYDRKFTIEGARQHLKKNRRRKGKPTPHSPDIDEIRAELIRIRDLIDTHRPDACRVSSLPRIDMFFGSVRP
jgi:hypothetical protein